MKIGLIDVDGHNFPNLPLMKLSAYHKSLGDEVIKIDKPMDNAKCDKVYMSKVFTFTDDWQYPINADVIIKSGTGYDYPKGGVPLTYEIEHQYPDYSLYNTKTAYGFLTRGCPRNCAFCIVSKKEGCISHKVADLSEFWDGQKEINLIDSNITASKECIPLFKELVKTNAWITFSSGIDIRCMSKEKASLLNQMKIKMIHFAWDSYEFKTYEKLKKYRPMLDYDSRKLRVYVLTNFNTTHEQDIERIMKLRELGYSPYTMMFEKETAPYITRQMARWTNSMYIWRSCETFDLYKKTETDKNQIRWEDL
jgi:hypothetical protein